MHITLFGLIGWFLIVTFWHYLFGEDEAENF